MKSMEQKFAMHPCLCAISFQDAVDVAASINSNDGLHFVCDLIRMTMAAFKRFGEKL